MESKEASVPAVGTAYGAVCALCGPQRVPRRPANTLTQHMLGERARGRCREAAGKLLPCRARRLDLPLRTILKSTTAGQPSGQGPPGPDTHTHTHLM